MVELEAVGPDGWARWREVRLAALTDAPQAFSSRLEEWEGAAEERWRARLAGVALNLLALDGDRTVGMVSATAADPGGVVELLSTWVDPGSRSQGVGDLLLAGVIGWATGRGADRVILSVLDGNGPAAGLYHRHGFRETWRGEDRPGEIPMGRPLVELREARADDLGFLAEMLREAALWRPGGERPGVEAVLADPGLGRYLAGWPRAGDRGVLALDGWGARPVGGAWIRLFPVDDPGYGFLAPDVPELSVGVVEDRRGQGIGRALLEELLELARQDGHSAISLSVEVGNPAGELYRRLGFRPVGGSGASETMRLDLDDGVGRGGVVQR